MKYRIIFGNKSFFIANAVITLSAAPVQLAAMKDQHLVTPPLAESKKSFVAQVFSNKSLVQKLIEEFDHTGNFEHAIPTICAQAHIAPEKATRFTHTHRQYPMILLPLSTCSYIYALHDHQPVGHISFGHLTSKYHLFLLKVQPDHRRHGIASMLLLSLYATVIAQAKSQEKTTATIFWEAVPQESEPSPEQLVRFYQDHGAERDAYGCDAFNSMIITLATDL